MESSLGRGSLSAEVVSTTATSATVAMAPPNPKIAMSLDLHGSGWATFRLQADGSADEISGVSYLSDPLAGILWAGLAAALHRVGEFVLHQEPGAQRYAVFFDARGAGGEWCIARYVYEEDLDETELPVIDRAPAFRAKLPSPDAFAAAALTLAEDIIAQHGEEGYEALWDRDRLAFPRRALAALRGALAIEDRRVSGQF